MKDTRGDVARMPPLPKPELQKPAQPDQGPVDSNVPLAAHEWRHAFGHDVSEARRSQQIDNPKQDSTLDEPECRLCGRLNRLSHNVFSHFRLSRYYVVLYLNIRNKPVSCRFQNDAVAGIARSFGCRSFRIKRRTVRRSFRMMRLLWMWQFSVFSLKIASSIACARRGSPSCAAAC